MNKKIKFSFTLHNHQPVGNFPDIIENTFNCAYYPFLNVLERFPQMKATLHYSGYLYNWIESKYPEFLDRLAKLVDRGQVELLTGGFYEPILLITPEKDRIAQIKMLNNYIKKRFGVSPKGLWLTERIWDDHLIPSLYESGIEYIILDDIHLKRAGKKEFLKPYITEHNGYPLKIVSTNKQLRYDMPYGELKKCINYIESKAEFSSNTFMCSADDGEKFGDWPGTFEICYENDWFEELFESIENSSVIESVTISEYLDSVENLERAYIPPGSYDGMMKWSLNSEDAINIEYSNESVSKEIKPFINRGYWPNFFNKYPESSRIHKKMLYISKNINRKSKKALDHLFKAQCACAYWHGVFGGIYLPHLRHALWENLIKAEEKFNDGNIICTDLNGDFNKEIIVKNNNLNVQIWPSSGGQIAELTIKEHKFNLQNTFSRKPEYYHTEYIESVSDNNIEYDWYDRLSAIDHFICQTTTLEDFSRSDYGEQGDLVNKNYKIENYKNGEIILKSNGTIYNNNKLIPIKITKTFILENKNLIISWKIIFSDNNIKDLLFLPEWNLTLLSAKDGRYIEANNKKYDLSQKTIINSSKIKLYDSWKDQSYFLQAINSNSFWSFPIETISLNIDKHEKLYQGSSFSPVFNVDKLIKGNEFLCEVKFSME